jgi:hypothetical protein
MNARIPASWQVALTSLTKRPVRAEGRSDFGISPFDTLMVPAWVPQESH